MGGRLPALQNRLRDAEGDDERPARFAVVRIVLDWYRTWIARPIPSALVRGLLRAYLPYDAAPAEIEEALQWACESVVGAGRLTSQSLLAKTPTGDAITVHDYIQDADAENRGELFPTWCGRRRSMRPPPVARSAVGYAASLQGNTHIASEAWLQLAIDGDTDIMFNLGVMFADSDPGQARRWYEKAAEAGNARAMNNLGLLLADSDPGQARCWLEKAAEAGIAAPCTTWGSRLPTATRDRPARGMRRPPRPGRRRHEQPGAAAQRQRPGAGPPLV